MSHNTFGHLFRVTTWGESHGAAIGVVVDGCPSLIPLTEADILRMHADDERIPLASFHTGVEFLYHTVHDFVAAK